MLTLGDGLVTLGGVAVGTLGGGAGDVGGLPVTVLKMAASFCNAWRCASGMGGNGVAGCGFVRAWTRSCAACVAASADETVGMEL